MRLWRLTTARYADVFDGGYGLNYDGRWNSRGRPVTYCATSPALCVLEKLVHVEDPALLPALTMVAYEVPEDLQPDAMELGNLPEDWRARENLTQQTGDDWLAAGSASLLLVPSVIVAYEGAPDLNVLINHAHPDSRLIQPVFQEAFEMDARLL